MQKKIWISDPAQELKALAMEYIRRQDISHYTPSQLLDLYNDLLDQMWKHYNETCNEYF